MDVIALRNVRAYGRHGADPGERAAEQRFDLDLWIECDLQPAQRSDDLRDTIDYATLKAEVVRIVRETSHALLECLAGELLDAVFADARVARAEVSIAKPGILDGATPSVTLRRENPRYEKCP